jgi:hypothetical protein
MRSGMLIYSVPFLLTGVTARIGRHLVRTAPWHDVLNTVPEYTRLLSTEPFRHSRTPLWDQVRRPMQSNVGQADRC